MAEALKLAGYGTYAVGKWHVTPLKKQDTLEGELDKHNWPLQRGFDRYYGIIGGAANYFDPASLVRDNTPLKAGSDPEYKPEQYYFTDAISDHAVRFVGDHARQKAAQPSLCTSPTRRRTGRCTPRRRKLPNSRGNTTPGMK
jgi:arylsulfatase